MGMSIDETKQELVKILAFAVSERQYNAVKNALIIIDKYEKIEQILKDIPYGGEATVRRIQEVIEDGKID